MNEIAPWDRSQIDAIVAELADAWNAGDAARFAAPFALDAEQVNIFGARLIGRGEIADRHAHVFETIFRGSTNVLRVLDARYAGADVLLLRLDSVVSIPQGPMQGDLHTIASLVLCRTGPKWEIRLFHNTRIAPG